MIKGSIGFKYKSDDVWTCQCREGLHALPQKMFDLFLKAAGSFFSGWVIFCGRAWSLSLHCVCVTLYHQNILACAWLSRKVFGLNNKVTKSGKRYPKSVSVLKIHFNVANSLTILLLFENLSLTLHCHCRLYTDNGSAAWSRALHNVKASSMLCSGLSETWEISNCSSGTLSEVNATGMHVKNVYWGVQWGYIVYSRHTFPEECNILAQADIPHVQLQGHILTASEADEWKWKPAFFVV